MRRSTWLLVPLLFLATAIVAFVLHPDPAGIGTHRQLGLPACWMRALTGWPCPSCGLTTSFAQLANGNLRLAFAAHPLGPPLFALFAWGSVCSLLEFRGKTTAFGALLNGRHFAWVGGGLALFMLVWLGRLVYGSGILPIPV
jgi:Protein of unknown function (DUF2752).